MRKEWNVNHGQQHGRSWRVFSGILKARQQEEEAKKEISQYFNGMGMPILEATEKDVQSREFEQCRHFIELCQNGGVLSNQWLLFARKHIGMINQILTRGNDGLDSGSKSSFSFGKFK